MNWYTAPVVSAVTDEGGNFTITDMPVGKDIPLVVQVGKWRKVYKLSNVSQCTTNDAASLAGGKLRLPKNHTEGSIPNIAVSTGALDSLECLLHRIGIDDSEYTGDPTTGPDKPRLHIFTGGAPSTGGAATQGAVTQNPKSMQSYQYLWDNNTHLNAYDVVLLSCEGNETAYLNDAAQSVMLDYVNGGGRLFASHYHYVWFTKGPFAALTPALAAWSPDGVPGKTVTVGPQGDLGSVNANIVQTLPNGMPFPEGKSLHQWLSNVGALQNDKLPIWYARHNADISATNKFSQGWVTLDPSVTDAPNAAEYFSFDTPVGSGAGEQCGRVVYSDLHVSGGIGANNIPNVTADYEGLPITPMGCANHPLTAQEKALEFMLFDLSSCLVPIGQMTMPPLPQ
jgi:hypothetical protein